MALVQQHEYRVNGAVVKNAGMKRYEDEMRGFCLAKALTGWSFEHQMRFGNSSYRDLLCPQPVLPYWPKAENANNRGERHNETTIPR